MRITATAREQNRARILRLAAELFTRKGFDATTTRDIAAAVGMASGTLFNYFASKEDLALTILADALEQARAEFEHRRGETASLEEELFFHIQLQMRHLKESRAFVGPVMESAMGPFARRDAFADRIRAEHLEIVGDIIRSRIGLTEPPAVTLHLYWSLYLGVIAYWSRDESRHQEETLAILDHATRLFAKAFAPPPKDEPAVTKLFETTVRFEGGIL